jgi:hypothetical protein
VLCPACREALARSPVAGPPIETLRLRAVCFQCYRAGLDREHALRAAGRIDTASASRFQEALPFEPVNRPRLDRLRMERAAARARLRAGVGQFGDRRRRAQIAARHALQRVGAELRARASRASREGGERGEASLVHAAELQLPEAWLPFVVSR